MSAVHKYFKLDEYFCVFARDLHFNQYVFSFIGYSNTCKKFIERFVYYVLSDTNSFTNLILNFLSKYSLYA